MKNGPIFVGVYPPTSLDVLVSNQRLRFHSHAPSQSVISGGCEVAKTGFQRANAEPDSVVIPSVGQTAIPVSVEKSCSRTNKLPKRKEDKSLRDGDTVELSAVEFPPFDWEVKVSATTRSPGSDSGFWKMHRFRRRRVPLCPNLPVQQRGRHQN